MRRNIGFLLAATALLTATSQEAQPVAFRARPEPEPEPKPEPHRPAKPSPLDESWTTDFDRRRLEAAAAKRARKAAKKS